MRFELYGCSYKGKAGLNVVILGMEKRAEESVGLIPYLILGAWSISFNSLLLLDSLQSYSMPDGSFADGLDLRDFTYDGIQEPDGALVQGLGKLYDGVLGKDNFEKHPHHWVGWRKDIYGPKLTILFKFASRQNISAVLLHTSNFLKHSAQVRGLRMNVGCCDVARFILSSLHSQVSPEFHK